MLGLSIPETNTLVSTSVALFAIHLFYIGSINSIDTNTQSLWHYEILHIPISKWFISFENALLILNGLHWLLGKGKYLFVGVCVCECRSASKIYMHNS